ncbi:O-antigen ligase family protein [Balneola sp. MJW-20]|uniref:O-antigen ligase family protein n=1 Tax=Gracilimonas aurantiaca TaxID=3234185 RepID=UPI00390A1716
MFRELVIEKPLRFLLFRPLGMNKNAAPALWVTIIGMMLSVAVLFLSNGNILAAGLVLIPYFVVVLTIYKIEYSLYIFLFSVLFFDQFPVPGFDPFTYTVEYFNNLKEIQYLPYISAGVLNPLELNLLLIIGVWFFSLPIKRDLKLHGITVWPAFLLFLGTFIFSFVYGIKRGDFMVALWEVRALFYMCIVYMLVPQIITTEKQIKTIVWVAIAAITLKAMQAFHRYIMLGFTTEGFQALSSHEDPVFISTIFILTLAVIAFGVKGKEKKLLLLLCIPLYLGFHMGMRRAAYAGLFVSVAAFFILMPTEYQISFVKKYSRYMMLVVLYFFVFWHFPNTSISGPVNMIKGGIDKPTKEENFEDYYSNLYRDFENYNLAVTIERKPIIGIGFGNKYDMPLKLANIPFPLKDYIPHNEIMWYLIKTGSLGFFMFWLFFNSFAFRGAQILKTIKDPYMKAICAMVVIAVINQMVVSYFDLQLTFYRNMVYLGVLMGLMPALKRIGERDEEEALKLANTKKKTTRKSTGRSVQKYEGYHV